jgi:putative lipoprotein
MNTRLPVLAAACLTIAACASPVPERVDGAAAAPLVNTQWRLTQLGDQVVGESAGANAVGLQLQSQNLRLTGFGGCNRMFGGYSLDGDQLKFDQIGATKMACLDPSRMRLEQSYFDMLSRVARWKITDNRLALLDTAGATLGTFVASVQSE